MSDNITKIRHRLAKIESLKSYQEELYEQIKQNAINLAKAEAIAEKENRDVEKLKHASLSSILAWFAKDKEERLMKEEQEALRAMIHLKQLQEEQIVLQQEQDKINMEIDHEDALREALARLVKQEALKSPQGTRAKELYDQLEKEQLLEKELQEAISASYIVTDSLREAIHELDSASNWGIMDIAGGGMIASMAKHSHVDNAQKRIEEIKQDMRRFQKELHDVSDIELPNVVMERWLSLSDIFFDNFFMDFMVQSKINHHRDQLKDILVQICDLQNFLLDQNNECMERQIDLKEQIETITP